MSINSLGFKILTSSKQLVRFTIPKLFNLITCQTLLKLYSTQSTYLKNEITTV